jgi:hypothetical protein
MAYNPDATRERLEAERALVAGNLAAYRKQAANSVPGSSPKLIDDAIERAQRCLERIDQELAGLPSPAAARTTLSGAQALAEVRAMQASWG